MIVRAKRVLPGMALSLLLSAPAFAATSVDQASPSHKTSDTRAHTARPVVKTVAEKPHTQPTHAAARTHTVARGKGREVSPVAGSNGRIIRRAAYVRHTDASLIDDGTLWREHGSAATWQQTGVASWYGGRKWQGNRTTSGVRYDEHALTAAHATLPIGTRVLVVRQDGRGSVIVTINDRPGTRTRIIDLSQAAAKELGILNAGVAMVTLQPM